MIVAARPAVEFSVLGHPRTKGSLRPVIRQRSDGATYAVLIEQGGFELAHWRTLVAQAARKAMGQEMPLDGPLQVFLHFYFPRPAKQDDAHRESPYVWENKRWDIDKLERAILDAGTDAAVWHDDSQVAEVHKAKRYADDQHPIGVQVMVEALT